jgi:hypothetical protein
MADHRSRARGGLAAAAGLVTIFVLAASSGHAAPANPDADVCALVSLQAASNIVGRPVALARAEEDNGGASCVYQLTPDGPVIAVSLLNAEWPAIQAEYSDATEVPVVALWPHGFWSPRDLALHVPAPNGQVMRISLDRREGAWSGQDLRRLAADFAAQALQGF